MYTSKKIGFSLCFGEFGIEITGFNSQIMLPACCQAIVIVLMKGCYLPRYVPHVTGHNLLTQQHSKTPEISDSKSNSSICLPTVPVNESNKTFMASNHLRFCR
ncbi:hypothetical protein C4D60_Mb01t13440 [Musa balbisiana]|uniref:Uncharacterized protein n=1 Tax=Musa balbisiana TaxID=52838 RepID=A0A4S8JM74_MUSBA|nr:hypothetical protein C4D60_Mb01t13440 [Musa balbisiana]